MWAIIDMEFDSLRNYDMVKALYKRLNETSNSTGGLRYFYEPIFKKYPDYDENNAQNEYCRMEYIQNEKGIICSELWNNNPKKFKIIANKYLLLQIISEFKSQKDKFQTYSELFAKYTSRKDLTISQIDNAKINRVQSEQKAVFPNETQSAINRESDKNTIECKEENSAEYNDIKKYDERSLDL